MLSRTRPGADDDVGGVHVKLKLKVMYAFCFLQDYATISRCNCAIPTAAAGIDTVKLGKCMPTEESKNHEMFDCCQRYSSKFELVLYDKVCHN